MFHSHLRNGLMGVSWGRKEQDFTPVTEVNVHQKCPLGGQEWAWKDQRIYQRCREGALGLCPGIVGVKG